MDDVVGDGDDPGCHGVVSSAEADLDIIDNPCCGGKVPPPPRVGGPALYAIAFLYAQIFHGSRGTRQYCL
jgi:hypothetical protein